MNTDNKALTLRVENDHVVFAYDSREVPCSRHRLRLMRQHNLRQIFQKDNLYHVRYLFLSQEFLVPLFRHPHDVWMRQHPLMETYEGRIVTVSHRQTGDHLLVELAPNVLAFAECEKCDKEQEKVQFVPYKYNSKTKRIYGYLE